MKHLRVLALMRDDLVPTTSPAAGLSDEERLAIPWITEFDVLESLQALGHEVRPLGVYDDLATIRLAIREFAPHIAFNLMEAFGGVAQYDQNVVGYLELKRTAYTGCNPKGLMLARDKALSKKLPTYHRIRVPDFAVFPRGRKFRRPARLRFPLFVKSVTEDASFGISQASLVRDDESLAARIAFVHQHAKTDALAEEFIAGRELYVGVLGNRRLDVFPIWELIFNKKPEDEPLIATATAKWNMKYQKKWGITSRAAKDLSPQFCSQVAKRCRRIYRILGLSGYARMDFRLDPTGALYFLEANPNPALARLEDFAESGRVAGLSYQRLIHRIVSLGLRYAPH